MDQTDDRNVDRHWLVRELRAVAEDLDGQAQTVVLCAARLIDADMRSAAVLDAWLDATPPFHLRAVQFEEDRAKALVSTETADSWVESNTIPAEDGVWKALHDLADELIEEATAITAAARPHKDQEE